MTPRAPTPRFVTAVFISLLAHALMIQGGWLLPPEAPPAQQALEARLVSAPQPSVPPPPKAKPAPPPRVAKQPTAPPRAVPPSAAPPVVVAEAPEDEPSETIVEERVEATPPEPLAAPAEPAAPAPGAATEPVKTLPRKGRITYTMYFGFDGFSVGKTVQTWEVEANAYRLGSVSETTGIIDFFRSQRHIYLSEGRLTPRGLRPEKFFMSRTRRGQTEAAQARFDWEAGTLALGRVPQNRVEKLTADTQDIVSFMYQLALSPPPPGHLRLPITNGSRFETYDIEVMSEERIETPLGMLLALPVRQIPRPGAESVEIWLAVEYRYLPVKIRFFDREGKPVGEQVVNEIRISDE